MSSGTQVFHLYTPLHTVPTSPRADSSHGNKMMLAEGPLSLTLLGEMEEPLKAFQRKGNFPRDLHQPSLNLIHDPVDHSPFLPPLLIRRLD